MKISYELKIDSDLLLWFYLLTTTMKKEDLLEYTIMFTILFILVL